MSYRPAIGRILICDEISTNLQALGIMLKQKGYEVYVASNRDQAVDIATASLPDLILLDINPHSNDALRTCEHITKALLPLKVPVIFLTARTAMEQVLKKFGSYAVDCIAKPLNPPAVLARIQPHVTHRTKTWEPRAEADRDTVSRVAARHYFELTLALEWQRAKSCLQPLALVLAEVDGLAACCDKESMERKDILRRVAGALDLSCRRPGDLVGRYDDATFSALLPGSDTDAAKVVAKKMSKAVAELDIPVDKGKGRLTLSMGYCALVPPDNVTPKTLIHQTVKYLEQAKREGGDRLAG